MAYTTIDKPSDYFNTKLYSGNSSTQSITGVNFKPDLVWIKERTNTSSHNIRDIIRGTDKYISSDTTGAETTNTHLTSFDTDGFTLASSGGINNSGDTYVSWNFLASNTTASNTDGSITSTVSANTTSGFSIVSYTGTGSDGATVGHGLGATPTCIIIKNRTDSATAFWCVYHQKSFVSQSDPGVLYLNSTVGRSADTNVFGLSTVTINSNVFSLGNYNGSNGSSDNMIAYCFAEKKGFSKAFSYTGNGSSDGSFCYLGFRPAFVLVKRTDSADNWMMVDNKRGSINLIDEVIFSDLSQAEVSTNACDFLSNGFKAKTTSTWINASGGSYIGIAFAENPFTTSTGIPTTAR